MTPSRLSAEDRQPSLSSCRCSWGRLLSIECYQFGVNQQGAQANRGVRIQLEQI